MVLLYHRFRAGFKQAFHCCPCVPGGSYEGLELKSTRYLQTQTSVFKASRMETTMSTVSTVEQPRVGMPVGMGTTGASGSSLDWTSNGPSSHTSLSNTASETCSFRSTNNLLE